MELQQLRKACFCLCLVLVFNSVHSFLRPEGEIGDRRKLHGSEGLENFSLVAHLSSSTRYQDSLKLYGPPGDGLPRPPAGCTPIHYNLVSRHGTRGPTTKRMRELERVAKRLADHYANHLAASGPSDELKWIKDFRSPWHGHRLGGMLVEAGEEELYSLGQRARALYPEIFGHEYHPAVYPIVATQVPRASASAVAFGMGMVEGKGSLGGGKHRSFAVVTESKDKDNQLRFHKTCKAYKHAKKGDQPELQKVHSEVYGQVAAGLRDRYGLELSHREINTLWVLCKAEAAALRVYNRSCALLTPQEVLHLEWADDTEIHYLKGYGRELNYRMGKPLLADVVASMETAAAAASRQLGNAADELDQENAHVERAKLRFAHAETVIPYTCLLGLFQEGRGAEERVALELPFPPPPAPPASRVWKGNSVSPYGANTALVLYQCPANASAASTESSSGTSEFLVLALHNEKPVQMPACGGDLFCPLEKFLEKVAAPHLAHDFDAICAYTPPKPMSFLKIFDDVLDVLLKLLPGVRGHNTLNPADIANVKDL